MSESDTVVPTDIPDIAGLQLTGTPRADRRDLTLLMRGIGSELAYSVANTSHDFQMQALRSTPRVVMDVRVGVNGGTAAFYARDDENEYYVPFVGPPDTVLHSVKAREMYRNESIPGNQYIFEDLSRIRINQLVTVFNLQGVAIGSIPFLDPGDSQPETPRLMSHTDALCAMQAPLLTPRSEEEYTHLFSHADSVFGPETEYAKKTGRTETMEQYLSLEHACGILERLDRYKDNPTALDAIYTLAGYDFPYGEAALQLCDSQEELIGMVKLLQENPAYTKQMLRAFLTIEIDTSSRWDKKVLPYEKPFDLAIFRLGRNLVKGAVFSDRKEPIPDWYLHLSCRALSQVLDDLYGLPSQDLVPPEQAIYHELSEYVLARGNDPAKLAMIEPLIERYFLLKLDRILPGAMKTDRERFYATVGEELGPHANESTGDDEMQLLLQIETFRELVRLGYWKQGMVYQDDCCGDGARILRPFLQSSIMREYPPGVVIGVDGRAFPQPADGLWHAVQCDLTSSEYPGIATRVLDSREPVPVDVITNIWSGINDNDPLEQEQIFANMALVLKKRTGDTPGGVAIIELPLGYIEEMIAVSNRTGREEMGEAPLAYPTGDGIVTKTLEIIKKHDIVIRARRAGFRILNLPDGQSPVGIPMVYETTAGKTRGYIVMERIGDPEPSLARAAEEQLHGFSHTLGNNQVLVGSSG